MPEVGELITGPFRMITPDEDHLIKSAACGSLPLGLTRQAPSCPTRVRLGIFVRHMDDGVIFAALD